MKNERSSARPRVGVSRCLLGDAVRYDGQSKTNTIVIEQLAQFFQLVPVCPEVEAGLSIPRPPVQLTGSIADPKLTGRDDPVIDITDLMRDYCDAKPAELKQLAGFIFKSHSPSCGLNSTPVFIDGQCVTATSRGMFARGMLNNYPDLPVIEDSEFDQTSIDNFIKAVHRYRTT